MPLPGTLRWAFPFVGMALALCLFSLGDQLLRVLGDGAYGWALIVPLGLVGVASGRLWIDTVERDRLRITLTVSLGIGLVWLVLAQLHAWTSGCSVIDAAPALQLTAAMVILVITGWLLGLPLAAGLRLVGAWDPAPVSWCYGAHLGGWAVGGGVSALLVYYVGVAKLWPIGSSPSPSAPFCWRWVRAKEAPNRWFVRRVR